MRRWGSVAVLLTVCSIGPLTAVRGDFPDGYNHPEVAFSELETEHFLAVFPPALERTARLAVDLLEEVHPSLCAALGAKPAEKTTVVLADFDDVGFNNFARRMQHVIYLSNPIINQARVDREPWLRHLLTHEYVHVLNGWALRRFGRVLGDWIEWSGMELQPQWFTEGLAEYLSSGQDRGEVRFALQAAQQNQLLYGGKLDLAKARYNVIETAVVYKQGHSMCLYLAEKYGAGIFRRILDQYGAVPQFDIAFRVATGELVEGFTRHYLDRVRQRAKGLPATDPTLGATVGYPTPLEAALGARVSPDGRTVAVYGVADWEEPIPGLYLMSPDGSHFRRLADNLDLYDSWKLSWSADSRYLMYCGRVKGASGAVLNAAFVYDRQTDRCRRLALGGLRVAEPELSPDGQRVAFISYHHERAVLAVCRLDGSDLKYLSRDLPEDCFSPAWSPDGARLAFSVAGPQGTDLATINSDGTGYRRLTEDAWPDQYPSWSPDGRSLVFISYRESDRARSEAAVSAEAQGLSVAATNLYSLAVSGGPMSQLTHITSGGGYYPVFTPDGQAVVFSLFQVRQATVRRLELSRAVANGAAPVDRAVALGPAPQAPVATPIADTPAAAGAAKPAKVTPSSAARARPYRALDRLVPYVWRPYKGQDGLGDKFGVRMRMADPLLKHQVMAEVDYGSGESDQYGFQVQYLNSQTAWVVGANAFRRVPDLRAERGAMVAETSTGMELLAELPLAFDGNPYAKDKFRVGYEMAWRHPFRTIGGVLRPAPAGARVAGPSIGYSRTQLLPGLGDQELKARYFRADRAFGSALSFNSLDLTYSARFFAPSPRAKVGVAVAVNHTDGDDFTRQRSQQSVLAGEVRYDWRAADQVLSRHTWPYFHVGPVELSAAYQMRQKIGGRTTGLDLRDRLRLELRNTGYLTRQATYSFTFGPTFFIGSPAKPDWAAMIRVDLRDLPY